MLIVLSGHQSQAKKAAKALESAGFEVVLDQFGDPDRSDHGLAAETLNPTCFLTVRGAEERVDAANDAVTELGWRLRAHWEESKPLPKQPLGLTLARLGIDPAELKKLIGVA